MGTACYKVNKMKNGKRWNKKHLTKFGFMLSFLAQTQLMISAYIIFQTTYHILQQQLPM